MSNTLSRGVVGPREEERLWYVAVESRLDERLFMPSSSSRSSCLPRLSNSAESSPLGGVVASGLPRGPMVVCIAINWMRTCGVTWRPGLDEMRLVSCSSSSLFMSSTELWSEEKVRRTSTSASPGITGSLASL